MRVETHDEADRELLEESRYLEEQRSGYGQRFIAEFEHATDLIGQFPHMGHKRGRVRVKPLLGFSHNVIYVVREDSVLVVAVAHTSRKWGYWRRRLRE
jgi:plasmid stabilization system protein ParE